GAQIVLDPLLPAPLSEDLLRSRVPSKFGIVGIGAAHSSDGATNGTIQFHFLRGEFPERSSNSALSRTNTSQAVGVVVDLNRQPSNDIISNKLVRLTEGRSDRSRLSWFSLV